MIAPRVAAVATALPPYVLGQADARAFAESLFAADERDVDRLLAVFETVGVRRRNLVRPLEWFQEPRSFATKNEVFRQEALALATHAAQRALDRAQLHASAIGALVFVSTTGISTPSLDGRLVQALDLRRTIARVPLWGFGCAGGGSGVARGAALSRGLREPVLVVAVETCSATFVHSDRSRANLIATSLFGDGAAAAVITMDERAEGPEIVAEHAMLLDDSEHVMGWEVTDDGLRVRFSPTIPAVVAGFLPRARADAMKAAGITSRDLAHHVLHPGGPKVLAAYEKALQLSPRDAAVARAVLAEHGNMSSPSVLFVLERFLAQVQRTDGYGFLCGVGPGFCAEGVVFRW